MVNHLYKNVSHNNYFSGVKIEKPPQAHDLEAVKFTLLFISGKALYLICDSGCFLTHALGSTLTISS